MNSSNASASDPVPRLSIGAAASAGGRPSGATERLAPAARPAGLPDRSNAAPAAASSRMDALAPAAAAAAAASRRAFWDGASDTTIVSLTTDAADAPASGTRPPPVTTANAPASRPPSGGSATCSSYATVRRPAPRSRTVRLASSAGGVPSGATAMRAPDTASDGRSCLANPAGRSSSAPGPAATAPAFWAPVSLTTTVLLKPVASCTGASAPSRPTRTSAPRIAAPVRFVADRSISWSNSISSTPVPRSSLTGDGTAASAGGLPSSRPMPNCRCCCCGDG